MNLHRMKSEPPQPTPAAPALTAPALTAPALTAGDCQECTRAEAMRRLLGRGGAVSREFEPGMPIPAGAGIDRRTFLAGALGGLVAIYGAGRLGLSDRALSEGIAEAAATQSSSSPILVSLFVQGGMDALSLLGPAGDATYRSLRPTLAIAEGSGPMLPQDTSLTWAAEAAPLAALQAAGKATVIPAIGYTDPDMSHFTSRHYWEVGESNISRQTGWLGRYLDLAGTRANPFQGLSLDGQLNPVLATTKMPTVALDQPNNFAVWLDGVWSGFSEPVLSTATSLGDSLKNSRDAAIAQVATAASEVGLVHRTVERWSSDSSSDTSNPGAAYGSSVVYPANSIGDLPGRLAGLAAMIAAGVPLRCVSLSTDTSFDTHSSEIGTFKPGMKLLASALAAFQADLEARGIADRVLVHVWSEFGRRALENGSGGTDHGAAGTSLLIGTQVAGGMLGEFASLSSLDANGNQRENVDYRGVYCSLLEQWLGFDSAAVIPGAGRFPRYQLLKS